MKETALLIVHSDKNYLTHYSFVLFPFGEMQSACVLYRKEARNFARFLIITPQKLCD
jgi:hypothetical protein